VSHHPHLSVGGALFPSKPAALALEVTVQDSESLDAKLSQAVNTLIPAALERNQGILVIHHDYGFYTVRVDREVPCGMTHETNREILRK
jgi:hypothetical protein